MAAKAKKSTSKKTPVAQSATKVTRIKAVDTQPSKKDTSVKVKAVKAKTSAKSSSSKRAASPVFTPFIAIGGYFKGAWFELRQVRWPNRKQTWGLTAAVLIFSAFFVVLIVLLDALFKFLFELILK